MILGVGAVSEVAVSDRFGPVYANANVILTITFSMELAPTPGRVGVDTNRYIVVSEEDRELLIPIEDREFIVA